MNLFNLHIINFFSPTEDSTNQYLNENWRPVAESIKPLIAKSVEDNFQQILNKLFNFIPADYFISDIPRPSELYGNIIAF